MKLFYIILLTILLPCASVAGESRLRTITVQGQAEQDVNPDIAKFSINIIGKSATSDEAKKIHDKLLKSLMEISEKYKIDNKDVSTGFSSINPNYEYINNKRKFIDYSAQTQVNIVLRDLKQTGKMQESLIAAGFDNFNGPNYSIDKVVTYHDKILANSVDNAKQKASNIAEKLGEKLDKPVEIREENTTAYSPQPIYHAKAMMLSSAASEGASTQPSGVINIKSSVVVTFSLKE